MSVMRSWIAFAILVILAAVWYQRPSTELSNTTELTGVAMTIPYRVVIGASLSQEQQKVVQKVIADSFSEIDDHYNQFNPDSEVSQLNRLRAGQTTSLSPSMNHFLALVDRFVQMTEGRFDPTIEPLKKLWLPHLNEGTVPTSSELAAVKQVVGWKHVHLSNGTFTKDHDDVQLNLDAVAKGFGVDLLTYNISQAGYPSVLVDWGGEVKAIGQHPEGRPWRIFINGLDDSTMELQETAVATSGDYYQNWNVTQPTPTTYCHVFDPHTLRPIKVCANSVASASVMASSCAAADALATAAMVFESIQDAQSWAGEMQDRYPSLSFWLANKAE